MRLEQFYYLVETAKYKSITKASEQIHVSQPTISEALRSLEKELGIILYKRYYQGIYLTPQGEKVVELSQQILNLTDEITRFASTFSKAGSELEGNLTVYSVPTINSTIIPKIIPQFLKKHPKVKFSVNEKHNADVIARVIDSEAEFGFISATKKTLDNLLSQESAKDLLFEHIGTEKLCAVISNKSPLANKNSISVSELLKHPLIALDYPEGLELLSSYGSPNIVLSSGNLSLGMAMIVNDVAISLSNETLYHKTPLYDKTLLAMVPVKGNLFYNNYLIFRKQSLDSPVVQEFIACAKSQLL